MTPGENEFDIPALEAPSPNTAALKGRDLTYEFRGTQPFNP